MPEPLSSLHKDVACRKNLLWGAELDASVPAEEFIEALKRRNFAVAAGTIQGLAMLDHESGHRVVFIPRTGRIQIRLDALTRHEERIQTAEHLYETVRLATLEALGQAQDSPDARQPRGAQGGIMERNSTGE